MTTNETLLYTLAGISWLTSGQPTFSSQMAGPENGPAATYEDFLPVEGTTLPREGHISVSAKVAYTASTCEAVTFFMQFAVNGKNYPPSTVLLTRELSPGQITVGESISTTVYVPSQKHMFLRMHIWAFGETSHQIYDFYNVERRFTVKPNSNDGWWDRGFLRFCGFCS